MAWRIRWLGQTTVKWYDFSVTLLGCCVQRLFIHNARIGLVETLKYSWGSLPPELSITSSQKIQGAPLVVLCKCTQKPPVYTYGDL